MHFEILIEDHSGKIMLEALLPKILNDPQLPIVPHESHSFKIRAFHGLGHIPKNLPPKTDVRRHMLLNDLPLWLQSYGKTFASRGQNYRAAVIVVCDLDDRNLRAFRGELLKILDACSPQPKTRFCLAVEEGEAWLMGDLAAVQAAYPNAKMTVLESYVNDSICGTWETLADALCKGGALLLKARGYQAIGKEKSVWAELIGVHMDVNHNQSPSFNYFCQTLQRLVKIT